MENTVNDFALFLKQSGMMSVLCTVFSNSKQETSKSSDCIEYLGDNLPFTMIQKMKKCE